MLFQCWFNWMPRGFFTVTVTVTGAAAGGQLDAEGQLNPSLPFHFRCLAIFAQLHLFCCAISDWSQGATTCNFYLHPQATTAVPLPLRRSRWNVGGGSIGKNPPPELSCSWTGNSRKKRIFSIVSFAASVPRPVRNESPPSPLPYLPEPCPHCLRRGEGGRAPDDNGDGCQFPKREFNCWTFKSGANIMNPGQLLAGTETDRQTGKGGGGDTHSWTGVGGGRRSFCNSQWENKTLFFSLSFCSFVTGWSAWGMNEWYAYPRRGGAVACPEMDVNTNNAVIITLNSANFLLSCLRILFLFSLLLFSPLHSDPILSLQLQLPFLLRKHVYLLQPLLLGCNKCETVESYSFPRPFFFSIIFVVVALLSPDNPGWSRSGDFLGLP